MTTYFPQLLNYNVIVVVGLLCYDHTIATVAKLQYCHCCGGLVML